MKHLGIMELERIIGWREMEPGHWWYIDMEVLGMNKWNKSNTVVTVKKELVGPPIKFYAPPSLSYGLLSKPDTMVISYEGLVQSKSGHFYPKYKYA